MARLFFTWDDGHPDDLQLKDMHEAYRIPCMLFIPAYNKEHKPVLSCNEIANIESEFVEAGSHTYHHAYLTGIPKKDVHAELLDGKRYLEDILGHSIDHFCLPGGRYTKNIQQEALDIYRTVRTAKTMCTSHKFPVVDTTFHFYPRGWRSVYYNSFKNRSINILLQAATRFYREDYFEFIKSYIQYAFNKQSKDDIVLYGHSWEMTEYQLWGKLKDLFDFIKASNIPCGHYSEIC
jgi:peptidoglycan/xylan/chitin deacetylase (PgdA/CDA1 family)